MMTITARDLAGNIGSASARWTRFDIRRGDYLARSPDVTRAHVITIAARKSGGHRVKVNGSDAPSRHRDNEDSGIADGSMLERGQETTMLPERWRWTGWTPAGRVERKASRHPRSPAPRLAIPRRRTAPIVQRRGERPGAWSTTDHRHLDPSEAQVAGQRIWPRWRTPLPGGERAARSPGQHADRHPLTDIRNSATVITVTPAGPHRPARRGWSPGPQMECGHCGGVSPVVSLNRPPRLPWPTGNWSSPWRKGDGRSLPAALHCTLVETSTRRGRRGFFWRLATRAGSRKERVDVRPRASPVRRSSRHRLPSAPAQDQLEAAPANRAGAPAPADPCCRGADLGTIADRVPVTFQVVKGGWELTGSQLSRSSTDAMGARWRP